MIASFEGLFEMADKGDTKDIMAPKRSEPEASKSVPGPQIKELKVGLGNEPRSPRLPRGNPSGNIYKPFTAEEMAALKAGKEPEHVVEPFKPRIEDTFTEENFLKFLTGEITWGQLHAITDEDAFAFAKYAYSQYEAGRYFDAKKIFQALVIINPYDSYYHLMHGACLQMLDETEAALDEYSAAVQLDTTNIQALVNRAELNLQASRFDEAWRDLRRVAELDPTGAGPATQRARVLAAATAQALQSFQQVLKKDADNDAK